MKSGSVLIGNVQFLPGYCVLIAEPQVSDLTDLDPVCRAEFLTDMGLLGDAIMVACKPKRINYGILGNSSPILHAHVFPRYEWEPEERCKHNVWTYPEECWVDAKHRFNETKHHALKQKLAETLKSLMEKSY